MHTHGKLLLVFLASALALVVAEIVVRVAKPDAQIFQIQKGMVRLSPDGKIRYELVPRYISPRRDVIINEHGMRNPPVTSDKPPGTRRIAVIGDSIAFGMGAANDEHFSRHLEAALASRTNAFTEPVEVLNFGVPGYNIEQIAATLETRAAPLAPDLVLYLYCLNDPQETSRELEVLLTRSTLTAAEQNRIKDIWRIGHETAHRWHTWRLVRYRLAARRETLQSRTRHDKGIQDDMRVILDGHGVRYFKELYRTPDAHSRLLAGLDSLAEWQTKSGVPVFLVIVPVFMQLDDYPLQNLHDMVKTAAEERSLTVMDLLSVYQALLRTQKIPFFADPLHPNAFGYAVAAHAVADALEKLPTDQP